MMMKEGSSKIIAVTLTLLLCFLTVDSEVRCIESERHALLNFKQDLKDPSNRLASWAAAASNVDCCDWIGVVCHNRTGHVLQLHLRTFYPLYDELDELATDDAQYYAQSEAYERSVFGGKINPSLLGLKHLIYLDLSGNNFSGIQIPKFLGSMGSLRYLNLSHARFGGLIPHQLGNLSNLHYLNLGGNYNYYHKLYVKNLQWLSGLPLLQHLDLSSANLSQAADWLQEINKLPSLLELRLSFCSLSAFIPPMHSINFSSLTTLDLSYNYFENTSILFWVFVPLQLGNLSNLHYLNLGHTYLYVKNLQWLSGLPLLQHLDLSYANLSQASEWLQEINKLPSLSELRLSYCRLSTSIPPMHSINFSSLTTLDLSSNHFENTSISFWVFGLHNLVSLDLFYNQFQGPIPVHLQNLTSLRHLDLSGNAFNSSIPNWFYTFSHLEFLSLDNNILQGTISSSIGNLTSAISIDLSYNELKGKVPRSLGTLCKLREIGLSGNKWSPQISEIFESLSGCVSNGLEILEINDAQLSGQLTTELGQFKNLASLSLFNNSISGPIPWSIGNLSSLRSLDLGRNQINGTLPQSFGQLSKLRSLYIDSNMLEGVVSEVHFSNLTGLTLLYASKNRLTLEVSLDWIPHFQLNSLVLGSWNLGPKFPSWLSSQKQLWSLDISNAGILDRVPPWFWNLSSQFEYLNISHNQIYGEIPHIPLILSSASVIDVSSNNFTGPLPCISSNVTSLDLSNNSLSGSISHFLCYKMNEPKNTEFLNLGKNLLSGKISNCWMKWQSLIALNLGNNNFTGKIPASIGFLTNLQSLHLYNNKFSGKLLSLLKNCKGLFTIDIGKNEFDGSIPKWIGHRLSSLMILSLHSNNFYGQIPDELCALTSLQILDLSHNKLFGSIPKCVNNFSTMARNNNSNDPLFLSVMLVSYSSTPFESELLVIKGKSLEYSTTLRLVNIIDLSNNNLSGEIPKEVASLQGLQSLNLSSNILNGRIPENIGDMGSLESVDFSINQLSGQIPQSMSSLTFLSHLNLSNNNLIGRIPSSTQLQSLNASSFFGNKLCGPPLTDNCTINYVKPNIENKRSKDFGGLKVDWFFLSVALGFVIGFWVVLGPLLWNKQWRILYFEFLDHLGYKLSGVVAQTW